MPKKKPASKKKKVPKAASKVKVVKLKCPNCGEEDEKVLYCGQCEGAMDIVEVVEREIDEVENDVAVSKVVNSSSNDDIANSSGDDDVTADDIIPDDSDTEMDSIMNKGLDNIFPSDGASGAGDDGDDSDASGGMDLSDALNVLDGE